MSRTRIPASTDVKADPRIPFPRSEVPTVCRTRPEWFSHDTTTTPAAMKDIAQAKRACAGCPIVADCLKWALAHPGLTRVGVWAATTTRQRQQLRQRLVDRLGPDWVGVVAQANRDRVCRREARPAAPVPASPHAGLVS